ncbi:MAG: rhomboid family intramembrane serine protease [Actinomycetes bacterium]
MSVTGPQPDATPPVCYRHPHRETYIRCSRCDRPICPDCMIAAPVGFQCPECVAEGRSAVRGARTVFGGRVTGDPAWVTKVLVAANVVVFVVQQMAGPTFTLRYGMLSCLPVPGACQIGVASGQWYRLLTAAFLHLSLLHIGFNMLALWIIGPTVEAALGRVRYLTVYLLAALGGSVGSYLFSPLPGYAVGASGAIFGLFAAYFVIGRRLRLDISGVIVIIVINLVLGFVLSGIDWRAHLGGMAVGGVVAAAMTWAPRARRELVQAGSSVAVLALLVVLAAVRTTSLTG